MRGPAEATARNPPPRRPTRRGCGAVMGNGTSKGEKGDRRGWERAEPLRLGRNFGGCEASAVDPEIHGVGGGEGGREASGVGENPGGRRHGVGGGVESSPHDSTRHGEGGGVKSSQDNSTPNGRGGGVKSWQNDSTQNVTGGESSHHRTTRPPKRERDPGETKPWDPSQRPTTNGGRTDGGKGEGKKTHPPPGNQGARARWRRQRSATRQGGTAALDKAMEMAAGASEAGYSPKYFDSAAGATTENGKHPRREYNMVDSVALDRSQASAGLATGEDGHGATNHSSGQTQEEGGKKNPGGRARRRRNRRRRDEGEGPPKRSPVPNASGC